MLILAKAMVTARNSEQYRSVWLGSKAVIFLGTPHRGSSAAEYGKVLGGIARVVLDLSGSALLFGSINKKLIESLEQESRELLNIAEVFVPLSSSLHIVTYYETVAYPVIGLVSSSMNDDLWY